MRRSRVLNLMIVFLPFVQLASCQEYSIGPGWNFKLFDSTLVHELANAVKNDDSISIAKLVVNEKIPINYLEPKFGNTLLSFSIMYEKRKAMRKLLVLGADPNIRSPLDGFSPFLRTCMYCNSLRNSKDILIELIQHGADVNSVVSDTSFDQFGRRQKFHSSAIRIACSYGNLECTKLLVENGANLDRDSLNERSLVTLAMISGNLDIVKYLLKEKNLPVPEYCLIRPPEGPDRKKMTITDLLLEHDYSNRPQEQQLKLEIMAFLKESGKK